MPEGFSLHTDRLILRSWRESDLVPFAALNADPRVMEYFRSVLSREESDAMAAKLSQNIDDRGFGLYAVEAPGRAPFIGFVGVSIPSFPTPFASCVEVGWRLAHAHWGQGYATEAAAAAINDAFRRLDLDEILSFTVPQNHRSRRVMEKLGMIHSPTDDFDYQNVPDGHPLRRLTVYRLRRSTWKPLPIAV